MGPMTERRSARRYDLSLHAVVRAPAGAKSVQLEGTTRDVSTRGVYLLLDHAFSRNGEFDLTMILPTEIGRGAGVFVRAVCKVVRLEEWTEDGVVHLDLEVAPDDRGRVIGRQGRTADALRTLLEAVGRRRGIECDMEVVD